MILIIDGYNVLKKIIGASQAREQQRKKFITILCRYAHTKNHTIVIVFDGGMSVWPEKYAPSTKVSVVYVGKNKSADDYIKEYLEKHKNYDVLLVSSDRELNRYAAALSLASIDSKPFINLVEEALSMKKSSKKIKHNSLHKISENIHQELDELMSALIPEILYKNEDGESVPFKGKSTSKKERMLRDKLKKL